MICLITISLILVYLICLYHPIFHCAASYRVAKLASKNGKDTLLATKMAAKAELLSGNTELGKASTWEGRSSRKEWRLMKMENEKQTCCT